jgi:chemotaxis protein MotB
LVVGRTKKLMQLVGGALKDLPNSAIISGHTDSVPFANDNGETGYGNWELSADRANATRRIFITSGVSDDRITRVSGLSDTDPLVPDAPEDATNRRISVVVEYATAPTIEAIEQAIFESLEEF